MMLVQVMEPRDVTAPRQSDSKSLRSWSTTLDIRDLNARTTKDEDEPEVILNEDMFLRMSGFALADVTRRLPNVENVEKLVLTFCVVRKYSFKYFFSFYMFYPAKTM